MATKTSPRRSARRAARMLERAELTGYAAFGAPDRAGKYATFGLPYTARATR